MSAQKKDAKYYLKKYVEAKKKEWLEALLEADDYEGEEKK